MIEYVKRLFQAYYREAKLVDIIPTSISMREFGFLFFDKKGMVRHKGFLEGNDLKAFLVKNIPMHEYNSATLYHSPWKERMDEKGYIGCDLIFDIDCDHIDTPCKAHHDSWTCKECNKVGTGKHPEKCPSCKGTSFSDKTWLCDACLDKAKTETRKLVDSFLVKDFGIPLEAMEIYFSGNRGYHVHLEGEAFRSLDTEARREIADYITATGISFMNHQISFTANAIEGFVPSDPGWRGKAADTVLGIVSDIENGYSIPGLDKVVIASLKEHAALFKQRLQKGDRNWALPGIREATWRKILEDIVLTRARSEIDVPVTIDVHRLIRAPGSLHGKTGFKICKLARDDLNGFDPFLDPIVFKGSEEKVKMMADIPPFRIGSKTYGPYHIGDVDSVSLGAAVFLFCKNLGVVA